MTDAVAELIRRLEEATEGSRELDQIIKDDFVGFDPSHDLPKHWPMVGEPGPPHYTTSIDAALTLVPERCDWDIGSLDCKCQAHVMWMAAAGERWHEHFDCAPETKIHWSDTGRSTVPALALCIAALKAQWQITAGDDALKARARLPDRSE